MGVLLFLPVGVDLQNTTKALLCLADQLTCLMFRVVVSKGVGPLQVQQPDQGTKLFDGNPDPVPMHVRSGTIPVRRCVCRYGVHVYVCGQAQSDLC